MPTTDERLHWLAIWLHHIRASHRARLAAVEREHRFKRALPVTPFQRLFYLTLFGGASILFGIACMGATI